MERIEPVVEYDLTIRNGTIATAADIFQADIGIKDGQDRRARRKARPGVREIDATGRIITPGGVDGHLPYRAEIVDRES